MGTKGIIVIGAGPAGLIAAGTAAAKGAAVTVYDTNSRPARKLMITGKGRCNVTNRCGLDALIAHVPRNGRFLYSAFSAFGPEDIIALLEARGVPLKTERGNRVFPVSDKAVDVVDALAGFARDAGAKLLQGSVQSLLLEEGRCVGIRLTDGSAHRADAVIVATGGLSYPKTGSTGDGYRFAKQAGHNITPCSPSLVPLEAHEGFCGQMAGLSLKNVGLDVVDLAKKRSVFRDLGEMMFTHFGVTGPLILSASAHLHPMEPERYQLRIDLKPGLDVQQLDLRLQRDFEKYANRDFANALEDLLPRLLIPVVQKRSGIDPRLKTHQITREMRLLLGELLKAFTVTVTGFRPIEEAVVTRGGVDVKEIEPKTMQSKRVKDLYFGGEVLDVDAYTGGFNLQIAYSTGFAAGTAAASQGKEHEE